MIDARQSLKRGANALPSGPAPTADQSDSFSLRSVLPMAASPGGPRRLALGACPPRVEGQLSSSRVFSTAATLRAYGLAFLFRNRLRDQPGSDVAKERATQ